ncbi:MAG: metallophosphoesterase family protein [Gemmataceae bacterium]
MTVGQLFQILNSPSAHELRHKVGVMSPADGSAKVTTRLLQSDGWFFKADEYHRSEDPGQLRDQLRLNSEHATKYTLWHPSKAWFLLRRNEHWWAVSVCRALTTLRQLTEWSDKVKYWNMMICQGLTWSGRHQIGIDLNPSNFGVDEQKQQLYYLDDELYQAHSLIDFASTIVARIPEEPKVPLELWVEFGRSIYDTLIPFCVAPDDWKNFLDGLNDYPLTSTYEPQRQAVIRGLMGQYALPVSRPLSKHVNSTVVVHPHVACEIRPHEPQLTCLFADVHGNKHALEAVLSACKEMRVDSFLFLGDAVGYGAFPAWCIQRLAELPNAILLRGNHDDMVSRGEVDESSNRIAREAAAWTIEQLDRASRQWLGELLVEYRSLPWMAVHGSPCCPHGFRGYVYELTYRDNLAALQEKGFQVCFYGHSHVQFLYQRTRRNTFEKAVPGNLKLFDGAHEMLVNPGSVGQPRDGDPRAAFALWDRRGNRVSFHRVEYSVEMAMRAVFQAGLPEDLGRRLEIGR